MFNIVNKMCGVQTHHGQFLFEVVNLHHFRVGVVSPAEKPGDAFHVVLVRGAGLRNVVSRGQYSSRVDQHTYVYTSDHRIPKT